MLIYDEDGLNTIFNDPTFLSNYDVYKKDNMDIYTDNLSKRMPVRRIAINPT